MSIDSIIELANKLKEQGVDNASKSTPSSKFIVRSRDAGCLYGHITNRDGDTVHMTDARQMWRWHAKEGGTLLDCANIGVKPENCKFSSASGHITVLNACAIIPVSSEAAKTIEKVGPGDWS